MASQTSYGSNMLFQTISDDLNASLASADELSREFDSLLKQASSSSSPSSPSSTSNGNTRPEPQTIITASRDNPPPITFSTSRNGSPSSPLYPQRSYTPPSTVSSTSPLPSPKLHRGPLSSVSRSGPDSFSYGLQSPTHSPHPQRRHSPGRYDRSPRGSVGSVSSMGSVGYTDRSPAAGSSSLDQMSWSGPGHSSASHLGPYDSSSMGRRSPRPDRSPSPLFLSPASSTLPRNFGHRQPEEGVQRQKTPSKWNETDLDKSYEKKPQHTYDKTEWLRPTVPNSSWRESNLDGPASAPSPKKDPRPHPHQFSHSSLPRNTRITVPPDVTSQVHSPYHPQPIISRISIPPANAEARQRRPIPLSVIMRLQNPQWGAMSAQHPRATEGEAHMMAQYPHAPLPREFFHKPMPLPQQPPPPELRQPAIYPDVLNPGDIDAELEKLYYIHHMPVIQKTPSMPVGEQGVATPAPRPLSPTRLQPVVAPEAHIQAIPDLEEVLRIRAEIPRALKRRGSVDVSQPMKQASHYQPNQYKHLINKLFRRKETRQRGEHGSETSSSSDEEGVAMPPAPLPQTSTIIPDFKSYHSILRRSNREHKKNRNRARLSPLVLLLDGALVGELETVQRAVQEMSDPSQPNDEGITALHNAICGMHYNVVDFLVRIGANVSAPDSHGWTPLHCAASCNDRPLCEFLVRNGAAVMAMTESDGAIASQKCDPYAIGFDECESFLKGVEEAMGVENSGVLYALWNYPAQAPDELSFRDGDMVTILQKPEGSAWWWASLCGREGFVPNNYFGLFPRVRPKSLC